jgi:hypothetical protein
MFEIVNDSGSRAAIGCFLNQESSNLTDLVLIPSLVRGVPGGGAATARKFPRRSQLLAGLRNAAQRLRSSPFE